MDRKTFLSRGFLQLAREFARGMSTPPSPPQPPLRPPGVVAEARLLSTCPTCDAPCVGACHQGSIFIANHRFGPRWEKTPVIMPTETPCYLCTEMVCIEACPHGVLQPTPPEDVRMGRALLEPSLCEPLAAEGCSRCVRLCPLPGVMRQEAGRPPAISPTCVGCGLCAWVCPSKPKAITVAPSFAPATR